MDKTTKNLNITNSLKNRLLQTNKRSLIFYNSFGQSSNSMDLVDICSKEMYKYDSFSSYEDKYEFNVVRNLQDDSKKDVNRIFESRISQIKKKNNIAKEEKSLDSLFIGAYFIEGILDANKSNVFRAPLILYPADLYIKGTIVEITNINYDEPILNNSLLMILAARNEIKWKYSTIDSIFLKNPTDYIAKIIKEIGYHISASSLNDFSNHDYIKAPILTKEELMNQFKEKNELKFGVINLKNYWSFGVYDIASSSILSAYNEIEDQGRTEFIDELVSTEESTSIISDTEWNETTIKTISKLDYSQKTSISNALSRSQFIWGPPGTGKSETIVNLIANIMDKNKRALFITEKKVASDVVFDRLKSLKSFALKLNNKSDSNLLKDQVSKIIEDVELILNSNVEPKYNDYNSIIEEKFRALENYKKHFESQGKYYLELKHYLKGDLFKYSNFENLNISDIFKRDFETLLELKIRKIENIFNFSIELLKNYDLNKMWAKNFYLKIFESKKNRQFFYFNFLKNGKYRIKLPLFSKKQFLDFLNNKIQDTNYENWNTLDDYISSIEFEAIFRVIRNISNSTSLVNLKADYNFLCAIYCINHKKKYSELFENNQKIYKSIKQNMNLKLKSDESFIYKKYLFTIADTILNKTFIPKDGIREKPYLKLFEQLRGRIIVRQTKMHFKTYFKNFYELIELFFPIIIANPDTASNKIYIPFKEKEFDFSIFDEASQIYLEKCVPAMYRSKKYIVVGDDKQMPPTNFFVERHDDESTLEDDINLDDLDLATFLQAGSLLDFAASKFPKSMLKYHYRSIYRQLIKFSNDRYYDSKLIVVNKNKTANLPIEVIELKGIYQDGVNLDEANKVVQLLKEIAANNLNKTVGIITFNLKQQKLIENLVEENSVMDNNIMRLQNLEKGNELFIKNIENVQGDERDIIIFSIGYAKNGSGKFINNFGPINQIDGEKRLNVAITRAKEKMIIVKSVHSSEMNPNPNSQGAVDFKDFLKYCELLQNQETKEEADKFTLVNTKIANLDDDLKQFDSEFEVEVFDAINKILNNYPNLKLINQVETGGYKLDMAIYDVKKGEYILAIECDGYTYHSKPFDRRRDFERQLYLENRGWVFERILSTDWWDLDRSKTELFLNKVKSYLKE